MLKQLFLHLLNFYIVLHSPNLRSREHINGVSCLNYLLLVKVWNFQLISTLIIWFLHIFYDKNIKGYLGYIRYIAMTSFTLLSFKTGANIVFLTPLFGKLRHFRSMNYFLEFFFLSNICFSWKHLLTFFFRKLDDIIRALIHHFSLYVGSWIKIII